MRAASRKPAGLILVGVYKLLEGAVLVAAGFGAIHLLRGDVQATAMHLVHVLRIDPDNHYIHSLLARTLSVTHRQLRELSVGTFVYAALRLLEGTGLVLRKRWGEWLTIAATGLFIPLEVYELIRHLTWIKAGVFVINVAVLWYLIAALRRTRG